MTTPTQFVQVSNVDKIEIKREVTGGVSVVRVTIFGKDDNTGIQILAYPTKEVKPIFGHAAIEIAVKLGD